MSVIPFGVIGSVLGHIILGIDLSALSVFGIIAAAGVVVNDSLVMVDYVNNSRKAGVPLKQAVIDAGCRRFRAIMLTSLTTFIGLVPIMAETSMQAQMVIPMAVSLAFGVMFATVVTLCLVPCLYLAIEDSKTMMRKLIGIYSPNVESVSAESPSSARN
jgi:multidrug efflux pump subunit AcrB